MKKIKVKDAGSFAINTDGQLKDANSKQQFDEDADREIKVNDNAHLLDSETEDEDAEQFPKPKKDKKKRTLSDSFRSMNFMRRSQSLDSSTESG